MKLIEWSRSGGIAMAVAGVFATSITAQAATMYGVTRTDNQLISFDSATPGTIAGAVFITGLQSGESIIGLDWWNGTLYGVGSGSRLYTLNPATGASSFVGDFTIALNGTAFGFEANGAGGHLVTDLDQHLTINLSTGVATAESDLAGNPNITALAYHPGSGTFYAGDSVDNTIGTLDMSTGTYTATGAAGIDFARFNGFEISLQLPNTAYLASPAASSDPQANLYTVDLTTGATTLVGLIGNAGDNYILQGLTVVPEPSSAALLMLGFVALFGLGRMRRGAS
jgi:hypothetical protein